jgi:hypothetical protein
VQQAPQQQQLQQLNTNDSQIKKSDQAQQQSYFKYSGNLDEVQNRFQQQSLQQQQPQQQKLIFQPYNEPAINSSLSYDQHLMQNQSHPDISSKTTIECADRNTSVSDLSIAEMRAQLAAVQELTNREMAAMIKNRQKVEEGQQRAKQQLSPGVPRSSSTRWDKV